MSAPLVQSASGTVIGGTTINTSFGSNNTAGNLIFIELSTTADVSTPSISDTQGNTYTHLDNIPGGEPVHTWYAFNIKAGANTISVTSGTAFTGDVLAAEYNSIATASPFDNSGTPTIQSIGPGSGSTNPTLVTTSNANDILIGYGTGIGSVSASSPGSGYSNLITAANHTGGTLAFETKIVSSSGSQSASFGYTSSGGAWLQGIAAFKSNLSPGASIKELLLLGCGT